jgi:peptide/nickel transport system substrate-binding protein
MSLVRTVTSALFSAIVVSGLCSLLTACQSAATTHLASEPARLVIAVPAEPRSLSSLLLEGPSSTMIVPLVYSYLLTIDNRGNLAPDLAVQVPTLGNGGISADGRTIVYHLRKNAVWQDGAPVTAQDVVFTQHEIMNPNNNVYSRYGFERVQSISALDSHTVQIRLAAPFSQILTEFFGPANNYGIMPDHLLHGYANLNDIPFNAMPVGSGPYQVKEWARGDHVTLVSNPRYFLGPPKIHEIVLRFVADSNTVLALLRTGEVNAYFFSDPTHMREYENIPALRVSRAPFAAFGDLVFNTQSSAVASPQMRRAIVGALDVPEIVRNATRGTQTTADANSALFGRTFDPSVDASVDDPADARKYLAAHHPSLLFVYETGKAASASIAVQMQEQLRSAGVNLTLHAFTPELFRAPAAVGGPLFSGAFQMAFFEIFTTGDSDSNWYLGCSKIPPNGFNVSRFCDPKAEKAQEAVLASYEPGVQRRNATIVQQRVAQAVPFVSLWSQSAIYVTPKDLRGFSPSPTSPYWNAWAWSL